MVALNKIMYCCEVKTGLLETDVRLYQDYH